MYNKPPKRLFGEPEELEPHKRVTDMREIRTKEIWCTGCEQNVQARLTDGRERYPHRTDLADLPFWTCDTCHSWVGCAHKTSQRTRPLGVLANRAMMDARKEIHALIDPLWQSGDMARGAVYARLNNELGYSYHTGELRTLSEATRVYRIAKEMHRTWIERTANWG